MVYGYSLGGGVAAELAARHPVPVVLDRTFSSGGDQAAEQAPKGLGWLARLVAFTGCNFDNAGKIKHFKGKVFIAQEKGAEHFLERMRKAASEARHYDVDRLALADVFTAQLTTGHMHTGKNETLWFAERSPEDNQAVDQVNRKAAQQLKEFLERDNEGH